MVVTYPAIIVSPNLLTEREGDCTEDRDGVCTAATPECKLGGGVICISVRRCPARHCKRERGKAASRYGAACRYCGIHCGVRRGDHLDNWTMICACKGVGLEWQLDNVDGVLSYSKGTSEFLICF
jgi:hypothetical protein